MSGRIAMIHTCEQAIKDVLSLRGLDDVWWWALVVDAWAHVVGTRRADRVEPILEKSPLHETGVLTVSVPSSTWAQELSTMGLAARLNERIGRPLIQRVRFEIQAGDRRSDP